MWNYAFIDWQNLYRRTQIDWWAIDFLKFRRYLSDKYKIKKAYYFIWYSQISSILSFPSKASRCLNGSDCIIRNIVSLLAQSQGCLFQSSHINFNFSHFAKSSEKPSYLNILFFKSAQYLLGCWLCVSILTISTTEKYRSPLYHTLLIFSSLKRITLLAFCVIQFSVSIVYIFCK